MAGTLITPTTSVSPVGGGQITMTATTRSNFDNGQGMRGEYQQYSFAAVPARGFTFLHFELEAIRITHPEEYTLTESWTETGAFDAAIGAWVYETPPAYGTGGHFGRTPYWWEFYDTILNPPPSGQVTSMTVVAVFSPRSYTGLLIRNGAGTGLLRGDTVARPLVDA